MASKILALALLSSFVLITQAAFSPEEDALRKAITSTAASTYILTKNIVLTADLPLMADKKTLTVRSAATTGAPFKIDGGKKYLCFRSAPEAIVKLTLNNLIITGCKGSAVDIGGEKTLLSINKVNFINNARALNLYIVNANIVSSQFTGHTANAIVTSSEEGLGDDVKITSCTFTKNKAETGRGGGAVLVLRYASITVDRSKFINNTADYRGGAVRVFQAFAVVKASEFSGNRAKEAGGAISIYNSGLRTSSTTFKANVAETLDGGAVRISANDEGSFATFQTVKFIDNKAVKGLGGAFVLDTTSEGVFCGSTFSGNTGNGKSSNGHIIGLDNTLSSNPLVTIPAVTKAPGAAYVTKLGSCA